MIRTVPIVVGLEGVSGIATPDTPATQDTSCGDPDLIRAASRLLNGICKLTGFGDALGVRAVYSNPCP